MASTQCEDGHRFVPLRLLGELVLSCPPLHLARTSFFDLRLLRLVLFFQCVDLTVEMGYEVGINLWRWRSKQLCRGKHKVDIDGEQGGEVPCPGAAGGLSRAAAATAPLVYAETASAAVVYVAPA